MDHEIDIMDYNKYRNLPFRKKICGTEGTPGNLFPTPGVSTCRIESEDALSG